jgi:hypothetical protein
VSWLNVAEFVLLLIALGGLLMMFGAGGRDVGRNRPLSEDALAKQREWLDEEARRG